MRFRPTPASIMVFLLFAPACSPAQSLVSLKQDVQSRYNRLCAALKYGDLKTYGAMHTPECRFITPDGKLHTIQDLYSALAGVSDSKVRILNASTRVDNVTVQHKNAIAQTRMTLTVSKTELPKAGDKPVTHHVELSTLDKDTWTHASGIWLRSEAHMVSIAGIKVDGKSFKMPAGKVPAAATTP